MARSNNKISVVGAGYVGATLAQRIFESGIADVVLLDIFAGIAAGKALDLLDAAPITGTEGSIVGRSDYSAIRSSDIVVVTAGLPRKPGMSREDLIAKNAAIIKDVCDKVKAHAPSAILIIVTNPLDTMTYLARKVTGFPRDRVFGMAGVLDSSRLTALIADELKIPRSSVQTQVLGSHGDTMVPLVSKTLVSGKPVSDLIPKDRLDRIVKRARDRGAEIVGLLGTGSAFYSPSAAVFKMIKAILSDSGEILVASACLEGEFGLTDLCMGVQCKLGRSGIQKIVEIEMSPEERDSFDKSARAIKGSIELL